ncbi:MAG: histidinol dehydrogenase [bacterium]
MRIFKTSEIKMIDINKSLMPLAADLDKVQDIVEGIVKKVRDEGDAGILELTRKFDWPDATIDKLKVSEVELHNALNEVDTDLITAMTFSAENIRRYHKSQLPTDFMGEYEMGMFLGQRHTPVDSAACYVPTRKASIPSSLLMSVVPAQVANVEKIVVVGPCREDGTMPAGVLAAANLLGITEIYKLGGAVAMAAMAYGTETFPKVDKVVGPANIYGTMAKKALYGDVGVDGLYGPSEVVIIADGTVPAEWVAADLVSQSEHGEDSQSILITTNEEYAKMVMDAVNNLLKESGRGVYLGKALNDRGAIIITSDMAESAEMANLLAAEHLELAVEDFENLLPMIKHAGSILLGGYTPVPIGDYCAGPSHILPTGRTARFNSGIGVTDFLKRSSLIRVTPEWLNYHKSMIITFAEHEGLEGHANSIKIRSKKG